MSKLSLKINVSFKLLIELSNDETVEILVKSFQTAQEVIKQLQSENYLLQNKDYCLALPYSVPLDPQIATMKRFIASKQSLENFGIKSGVSTFKILYIFCQPIK